MVRNSITCPVSFLMPTISYDPYEIHPDTLLQMNEFLTNRVKLYFTATMRVLMTSLKQGLRAAVAPPSKVLRT